MNTTSHGAINVARALESSQALQLLEKTGYSIEALPSHQKDFESSSQFVLRATKTLQRADGEGSAQIEVLLSPREARFICAKVSAEGVEHSSWNHDWNLDEFRGTMVNFELAVTQNKQLGTIRREQSREITERYDSAVREILGNAA